jgi:hypothetical protein
MRTVDGRDRVEEDWRLEHLKRQPYLRGMRFQRKPYREYSAEWDHDHCAACWAKFATTSSEREPIYYEGFATCSDYRHGEDYEWVCPECLFNS